MTELTPEEIGAIIAAVKSDPNVQLRRAINRLYANLDDPALAGMREELTTVLGAAQTSDAFFDQRKLTEEHVAPLFKKAVAGFLRTMRSGGMSKRDSNQVESTMDVFADSALPDFIHPFIEGAKAGVHPGAPEQVDKGSV